MEMLTILIRIVCLLSWTTVFFMPKLALKRFLPVTILSALFTVTIVLIGNVYNFWGEKGNLRKKMWNHLLLVLGPFSIGNIWIFHLTYRKFGLYCITNLLNNLIYSFGLITLVEKANYVQYVKFTKIHHLIVTMIESFILYGYQRVFDNSDTKKSRLRGK